MKNNNIFSNLDNEFINQYFTFVNYKKNDMIFLENDKCNKLGILIEGEITISTLTYENKEYVINVLKENDLFGDTLLFSDQNNYLGNGIATNNCKVAYINKSKLIEALSVNKTFLNNFLVEKASKFEHINQRVKLLSQKSIQDKILFFLQEEMKKNNSNIIFIESKEKLAKLLNIPRPSLSRELILLQEKGYLSFTKHQIILHN